MADEIAIIRLINGDGAFGSKAGSAEPGPSRPGPNSLMGGVTAALKVTGIASAAMAVATIASTWKPLMNMIEGILKVVGFILMPMANAVMVILMPILLILAPIAKAVNTVFQPFMKLAMSMMKEAASQGSNGNVKGAAALFAGATGVLLNGLGAVISLLAGDIIKLALNSMVMPIQIIASGIDMLINSLTFGTLNPGLSKMVSDWGNASGAAIDSMTASLIMGLGVNSQNMAAMTGAGVTAITQFRTDMSSAINTIFGTNNEAITTIKDVMGFGDPTNSVGGALNKSIDDMAVETRRNLGIKSNEVGNALKDAVSNIFNKAKEGIPKTDYATQQVINATFNNPNLYNRNRMSTLGTIANAVDDGK